MIVCVLFYALDSFSRSLTDSLTHLFALFYLVLCFFAVLLIVIRRLLHTQTHTHSHVFAAGKEMWPVHSELIEMGLHVHPVLLTLASTLKNGVVSLEDGLLAKVVFVTVTSSPSHAICTL